MRRLRLKLRTPPARKGMRPGGGHAKGAQFERDTCVRLSLWVSNAVRRDCFWRSAMSGGRSTVAKNRTGEGYEACAGDITAIHPLGQVLTAMFVCECKCWADLKMDRLVFGYDNFFSSDWWAKLKGECDGRRQPLLFMKQNNRQELVATSNLGWRIIRTAGRFNPTAIVPSLDAYFFRTQDLMLLDFNLLRKTAKARGIKT